MSGELIRASIFHTPRNPFQSADALEVFEDGGLLIADRVVLALGGFSALRAAHPEAPVTDWRGSILLPGFIDTHVHFPQLRILGSLGESLLDWLRHTALPEESRMADNAYAGAVAREFVRALLAHGTTSALVFGSHFAPATALLFAEAAAAGVRIASGLVLSDRLLRPELHVTPAQAYRESTHLIERFHQRGLSRYAVTPRFALSASEAMLDVCRALLREHPDTLFQTHLNENLAEVADVRGQFPRSRDYLDVYEQFCLSGDRSVFAHNVHASDSEISRLAAVGATVAHCPCSNAALGSGIFPLRRHLAAGVRVSLGSDVGAGAGFGLLKEALQAFSLQRVHPNGFTLTPAHLLYLATRAGAEAMHIEAGDLLPGRSADFVRWLPAKDSVLASVLHHAETPQRALAALFTLGSAADVAETRIEGCAVYRQNAN